jgi:hypothetical protein
MSTKTLPRTFTTVYVIVTNWKTPVIHQCVWTYTNSVTRSMDIEIGVDELWNSIQQLTKIQIITWMNL